MTSNIYITFTYCLLRNYSYSQNRMAPAGIFVHIVRTDRSIPHSCKKITLIRLVRYFTEKFIKIFL